MDYSDIIYISEEYSNSLSRTQVSAGDIVISRRGSLGQCAIVDDTFPKLNISANIIAIKNPKGISAEFIRNYILSAVGQTYKALQAVKFSKKSQHKILQIYLFQTIVMKKN